ncbi:flagellar hook-basal body complex protein FliE [Bacillus horti]|uniref:Flagellar hook-basal body complex protein FliE n=1 Tax=Caldalkalibacillus horti TaxID=77523 RepID=A0ABT9VUV0_9BACI|nr:flagellar hook-basal body complex protein FliE [Bacillus horti]MDQ0164659.1 flagellar hook-basal body complex protein FliE [Bacillus horti]
MDNIGSIQSTILSPRQSVNTVEKESQGTSFSSVLTDALDQVSTYQRESQALTNQLVTGQVDDVHQVMIAAQKASLSLQLTVQVRNKIVESYQEIMRMQV